VGELCPNGYLVVNTNGSSGCASDYDAAWFARRVIHLPIPGTQSTSFTGTKVQILTQKTPPDHSPPTLRDIRNFLLLADTKAGCGAGGVDARGRVGESGVSSSGKTLVLHDRSGLGRVGVLACALLLHTRVVANRYERPLKTKKAGRRCFILPPLVA